MLDNQFRYFVKVSSEIDTSSFLQELNDASHLWEVDTSRQRKVQCQRHTQNIFLRAAVKPLPQGAKNANDVHESRLMKYSRKFPETISFCERVAEDRGGSLGRATLVALRSQSRVYPHVDTGEYYAIRDRYHLVLVSPHGSKLTANDETVVMREGELWVFNNKVRHSAENEFDQSRVHLIFDILPQSGRGYFVLPNIEKHDTQFTSKQV